MPTVKGRNPEEIRRNAAMIVMEHMAWKLIEKMDEYLKTPMPWGDEQYEGGTEGGRGRKPMIISDRGNLAKSLSTTIPKVDKDSGTVSINISMPYAAEVEWSSEPKQVDYNDIYDWVRRKLGVKNEKAAARFARNIVNKIAKEGIPPHPYIRPSLHYLVENISETLEGI